MKIPKPINTDEKEERSLTFKQWENEGRVVMRGEKAIGFNEKGKALFYESQTEDAEENEDEYRDDFCLFDKY